MKQLLTALTIVFAAFFLANNQIIPHGEFEKTTETFILPLKIANLATREPESKIFIPLKNVKIKQIADTWQAPRTSERLHQGQDLFAPRGSEIYSATNGYVTKIGENSLGGKTVFVAGAGGRFYYYAHLDRYAENLQVGDLVTPETIIGYVGNTGNAHATPPHLHFGVYTASGAINPMSLLKDRT